MENYFQLQIDLTTEKIQIFKRKSVWYSILRLLLFIVQTICVVCSIRYENGLFLLGLIPLTVLFFRSIRIHVDVKNAISFHQLLKKQLEFELDYQLNQKPSWNLNSYEIDPNHPYAHDIDVTGKFGLLHHVDRTNFINGKKQLVHILSETAESKTIEYRQKLIQAILPKSEWRDTLRAHLARATDPITIAQTLEKWKTTEVNLPKPIFVFSFLLSAVLVFGIIAQLINFPIIPVQLLVILFFVHNGMLASQLNKIKIYIEEGDKINDSFTAYETVLQLIGVENINHSFFKDIQQTLGEGMNENQIKKFQANYQRLTTLQHVLAALLLNGISGYHLWVFRQFSREKKQFSERLIGVLNKLETLDAFLSLAQFTQQHPHFNYPNESNTGSLEFTDLKHPLIHKDKSIGNSFVLKNKQLMILTGSNMSGKSTFLRTVGLNLSLMNAGCPIAAEASKIALKPIWASMRLSDSTIDDTSYFYAEVKRIQSIIETSKQRDTLVLLDELLRGTNSEDKLEGTIRVIEHLIQNGTTGFVATHDLEVCRLVEKYPENIVNNCFEAQINGTELIFDYTLREGICQVKSATFLLERAGITAITKSFHE